MLILLPPSEGKTPAASDTALNAETLAFPELNQDRAAVLEELGTVSAHDDALKLLGVGASLHHEVARNTRLSTEPAAPAHDIYSGVLYDALGYASLSAAQKRSANSTVVVISALWGALKYDDVVPAYRLSMSTALGGLGRLATFWKPRLNATLNAEYAENKLFVDCRSSTYAAAFTPPVEKTVVVNVFREREGKRSVVSHFAKHTRGELARHLLTRSGPKPGTAAQLLAAAQEKWPAAELVPATARKAHALNIVLVED